MPFRAFAAYEEHVSSYVYEVIWDNLKFLIKNLQAQKASKRKKTKKDSIFMYSKTSKKKKIK